MTTSDRTPIKSVTMNVLLKGVMPQRTSSGNEYYDVQILRDRMQFPDTLKCWDPGQLQHLLTQGGTRHTFKLAAFKLRKEKADDGLFGSYDWQILQEVESEPEVAPPVTAPTASPAPPRASSQTSARETAAQISDRVSMGAKDSRERSIEHQVALKEARAAAEYLHGAQVAAIASIGDYTLLVGKLYRSFCRALEGRIQDQPEEAADA